MRLLRVSGNSQQLKRRIAKLRYRLHGRKGEIMNTFATELNDFIQNSEQAQYITRTYERGLITFDEGMKAIIKLYQEKDYYWIIKSRPKKGGRWKEYSDNRLTHYSADCLTADLNRESNELIYRVFPVHYLAYERTHQI